MSDATTATTEASTETVNTEKIRVMVVDDHEVVRRGITEIVEHDPALEVVAEAGTVKDAIRRGTLVVPDVALVDLQLPDGTGIEVIRKLTDEGNNIKSIVLTSFDDDEALAEALDAGASAFVLKSIRSSEINVVIHEVAQGRVLLDERTITRRKIDTEDLTLQLTPSERRVMELIGEGLSNREIGEALGIAEKTVKNHITSLLSKMGFQRRTQVAAWVAAQKSGSWKHA